MYVCTIVFLYIGMSCDTTLNVSHGVVMAAWSLDAGAVDTVPGEGGTKTTATVWKCRWN